MYGWSPSATASSTPVTVTVCGAFQFGVVNVSVGAETPRLGRIAARHRDRDVGRRLRVQHDRERRGAAGLGRLEAGRRRDEEAGRVVVDVRDLDVVGIDVVELRIAALARRELDPVRDRAVGDRVLDAGDVTVCGAFQLSGVNVKRVLVDVALGEIASTRPGS